MKARLRGVELIFPVDVLEGDELVTIEQKLLAFNKIESGARDEGADYPGETKTILLPEYDGSVENIRTTLNGNIYDIGPSSTIQLKSLIDCSDILFSWGPIGCVEMSSFQGGQKILVTSAIKKPYAEDDEPAAISANDRKLPLHTFVIGDSGVEWWSRMADSEGEFNGDLSSVGMVSCLCRDSRIVSGLLSIGASVAVKSILRREANTSEWLYHSRPPPVVEEEDDEEEEDA